MLTCTCQLQKAADDMSSAMEVDELEKDETTSYLSARDDSPQHKSARPQLHRPCSPGSPLEIHPRSLARKSHKPIFCTTWIDEDDTGDFDPSEELRAARLRRARLKLRVQGYKTPRVNATGEGNAVNEATLKATPTLLVKLSFSSESGKTRFEEHVTISTVKSAAVPLLSENGYSLRTRDPGPVFGYNDSDTQDRIRQLLAPDLCREPTGHPAARGCWGCIVIGQECSLLEHELSWPCEACSETGEDCALVVPASRKRKCQRCKSHKQVCSYTYSLNHGPACQQCQDEGYGCVAGPHEASLRIRVRYGEDACRPPALRNKKSKVQKVPLVTTCAECRAAGRSCSLAMDQIQTHACQACTDSGAACTLAHLVPRSEQNKPRKRGRADSVVETGPPRCKTIKTSDDPASATKTIFTKFAHPIVFNHQGDSSRKPCHFCAEPAYAIFGLGGKQAKVFELADGEGLEEVSDGHRADGVENTRVCAACTLRRMQIIMCSVHEMRPIVGTKASASETNAAFASLLSGAPDAKCEWCAFCPSLAQYRCHSTSDGCRGCGLDLCEHCAVTLAGAHDGDLQQMLRVLQDEPSEQRPFGLRADVELLRQDGLLMRYVLGVNLRMKWSDEERDGSLAESETR